MLSGCNSIQITVGLKATNFFTSLSKSNFTFGLLISKSDLLASEVFDKCDEPKFNILIASFSAISFLFFIKSFFSVVQFKKNIEKRISVIFFINKGYKIGFILKRKYTCLRNDLNRYFEAIVKKMEGYLVTTETNFFTHVW